MSTPVEHQKLLERYERLRKAADRMAEAIEADPQPWNNPLAVTAAEHYRREQNG